MDPQPAALKGPCLPEIASTVHVQRRLSTTDTNALLNLLAGPCTCIYIHAFCPAQGGEGCTPNMGGDHVGKLVLAVSIACSLGAQSPL